MRRSVRHLILSAVRRGARTWLAAPVLVSAAACAPRGARPLALSPIPERITNAVVAHDIRTMMFWQQRLDALGSIQSSAAPSEERTFALARANAWLAFARDAYDANPRDATADSALAQVRRIASALEHGGTPPPPTAGAGAHMRSDLWLALDSLRALAGSDRAALPLADVELALVRADHEALWITPAGVPPSEARRLETERRCRLDASLQRAASLLDGVRARTAYRLAAVPAPGSPPLSSPAPAPVGVASPALRPAPDPPPTPSEASRQPLRRVVHFALDADLLSAQSRAVLDGVVTILRAHPKVSVALDGYTDPRGGVEYNRALATRRASAVRRYLAAAHLDLARVTVVGVGTELEARLHTSVGAFARDRRVTLAFLGPDGAPLTVAGLAEIDHERDLQLESGGRARGRARAGGAGRGS